MSYKPFKGLNAAQLSQIRTAQATLERIESITGVPWQAMAGIWTRESFSIAQPKTPGGCWQFDPIPSPGVFRGLLDRFTRLSDAEKRAIVSNPGAFFEGGVLAACFLRMKVGPVVNRAASDAVIKDAMWGYNGRVQKSVEFSAYVMNGYDAAHYPLRVKGSIPKKGGGRERVDFDDERPGSFTVYKQLKEWLPYANARPRS